MKRFEILFFTLILGFFSLFCFAVQQGKEVKKNTFLNEFQNYQKLSMTKMRSIRSRADYMAFKTWKKDELKKLLTMLQKSKITPDMYSAAVEVFFENDRLNGAIKYAKILIKSNKANDDVYYALIESYLKKGDVLLAENTFNKISTKIKNKNLKGELEGDLADMLMNKGYFKKAAKLYNSAMKDSGRKEYKDYFLEGYLTALYKSGEKTKANKLMDEKIGELNKSGDSRGAKNIEKLKYRLSLVGKMAPELLTASKWLNSKPLTLKALKGKVVILDFWAPWCPPCRMEIKELAKVYPKLHKKGLEIIGITSFYGFFSDGEMVKKNISKDKEVSLIGDFLKKRNANWPIAIYDRSNKKVYNDYGVYGIPEIVFIGKNGKIKRVDVGFNSDFNLEKFVEKLLAK